MANTQFQIIIQKTNQIDNSSEDQNNDEDNDDFKTHRSQYQDHKSHFDSRVEISSQSSNSKLTSNENLSSQNLIPNIKQENQKSHQSIPGENRINSRLDNIFGDIKPLELVRVLSKIPTMRSLEDNQLVRAGLMKNKFFTRIRKEIPSHKYMQLLQELSYQEYGQLETVMEFGDIGKNFHIILQGQVFVLVPKSDEVKEKLLLNKEKNLQECEKEKKELIKFMLKAQNHHNQQYELDHPHLDYTRQLDFTKNINDKEEKDFEQQSPTKGSHQQDILEFQMDKDTIEKRKIQRTLENLKNRQIYFHQSQIAEDISTSELIKIQYPDFNIVKVLNPGEAFGEIALRDKTLRTATIICKSECKMAILQKQAFQQILEKELQKSLSEKVNFLKSCRLFQDISAGVQISLLPILKQRHFQAGEIVYNLNDKSNKIYFVLRGQVDIIAQGNENPYIHKPKLDSRIVRMQENAHGKLKLPKTVLPDINLASKGFGEWFGEVDILLNTNRMTKAVCKQRGTLLLRVSKKKFLASMDDYKIIDIMRKNSTFLQNQWKIQKENLEQNVVNRPNLMQQTFQNSKEARQIIKKKFEIDFCQNDTLPFCGNNKDQGQTAKHMLFNNVKQYQAKLDNIKDYIKYVKGQSGPISHSKQAIRGNSENKYDFRDNFNNNFNRNQEIQQLNQIQQQQQQNKKKTEQFSSIHLFKSSSSQKSLLEQQYLSMQNNESHLIQSSTQLSKNNNNILKQIEKTQSTRKKFSPQFVEYIKNQQKLVKQDQVNQMPNFTQQYQQYHQQSQKISPIKQRPINSDQTPKNDYKKYDQNDYIDQQIIQKNQSQIINLSIISQKNQNNTNYNKSLSQHNNSGNPQNNNNINVNRYHSQNTSPMQKQQQKSDLKQKEQVKLPLIKQNPEIQQLQQQNFEKPRQKSLSQNIQFLSYSQTPRKHNISYKNSNMEESRANSLSKNSPTNRNKNNDNNDKNIDELTKMQQLQFQQQNIDMKNIYNSIFQNLNFKQLKQDKQIVVDTLKPEEVKSVVQYIRANCNQRYLDMLPYEQDSQDIIAQAFHNENNRSKQNSKTSSQNDLEKNNQTNNNTKNNNNNVINQLRIKAETTQIQKTDIITPRVRSKQESADLYKQSHQIIMGSPGKNQQYQNILSSKKMRKKAQSNHIFNFDNNNNKNQQQDTVVEQLGQEEEENDLYEKQQQNIKKQIADNKNFKKEKTQQNSNISQNYSANLGKVNITFLNQQNQNHGFKGHTKQANSMGNSLQFSQINLTNKINNHSNSNNNNFQQYQQINYTDRVKQNIYQK